MTTPFKADRDAEYFYGQLEERRIPVHALILNRVWPVIASDLPAGAPALASRAASWYAQVSQAHRHAWQSVSERYADRTGRVARISELSRDVDGLPALYEIARSLAPEPL